MDLFGVGFRRPDLIPLYFGEQVARAGRHHTQIAGGLEEAEALRDAFVDLGGIARRVTHRDVVLFSRRENFVHGLFYDRDRKSTRLNSSHLGISYAVFCLKKK